MTPITALRQAAQRAESEGRQADASEYYQAILQQAPDDVASLHRLAAFALERGLAEEALDYLQRALSLRQDLAPLWSNYGLALSAAGRHGDAICAFARAIELDPLRPIARYNLGRDLLVMSNAADAEREFREAIHLFETSGHEAPADYWVNLGLALHALDRYDEAISAYDRALTLDPLSAVAAANKAASLYYQRRFSDALQLLEAWIERSPDDAALHYNYAMVLFSAGDLKRAFSEYEWRWRAPGSTCHPRSFAQPGWNGESFEGRTLLLYAEQGLGDTMHFVRFLEQVKQRGGNLIVEVQPEVITLLRRSFNSPGIQFIAQGEELPPFDLQLPLLSVPRVLGLDYATLPSFHPYLKSDDARREVWRKRFRDALGSQQLRVGLVWSGNPTHSNDRRRSTSWSTFELLIDRFADQIAFFSLQKGIESEDLRVISLGKELSDYAETAAVVQELDLVIAVDTSIVHLAGALGKPVWTLLPYVPDWRWVVPQSRTAWYPTMRLFWQQKTNQWQPVIEEVSDALEALLRDSAPYSDRPERE